MDSSKTYRTIEFSRDEQWVIHHIMLERLGYGPRSTDPPEPFVSTLAILEKIEEGHTTFSTIELDQIRRGCAKYSAADSTPTCDREVARRVITTVDNLDLEDQIHTQI